MRTQYVNKFFFKHFLKNGQKTNNPPFPLREQIFGQKFFFNELNVGNIHLGNNKKKINNKKTALLNRWEQNGKVKKIKVF